MQLQIVKVKYIDIESLPALIVDRLVESSKQTPEYSEFPLIKSILLKHNKASAFTLSRAIDLERGLRRQGKSLKVIRKPTIFIYLDKSQNGYNYGQILTPQVLNLASGLLENSRIFSYQEWETITNDDKSIEHEKTEDIKESLQKRCI